MSEPDETSSSNAAALPQSPSLKEELKAWAAKVQALVDEGKARRSSPAVPDEAGPVDVIFPNKK